MRMLTSESGGIGPNWFDWPICSNDQGNGAKVVVLRNCCLYDKLMEQLTILPGMQHIVRLTLDVY